MNYLVYNILKDVVMVQHMIILGKHVLMYISSMVVCVIFRMLTVQMKTTIYLIDGPTSTAVKGSGIFVSEINGDIMIVDNYGMKIYNNPNGNLMVTVSPEIVGTDGDFLYRFPWCNE
eukprot:418015_1